MKKLIQVVMLPTDKSKLYTDSNNKLQLAHKEYSRGALTGAILQHLYVTISQEVEPIKEGDWCVAMDTNIVFKANKHEAEKPIKQFADIYRKIISTTDPKLTIPYMQKGHTDTIPLRQREVNGVLQVKSLPQVQQSFLKEFVANPDGEWEVEYEKIAAGEIRGIPTRLKINKLKLNQDNTVTITPVKEKMFTLEEVINIIQDQYSTPSVISRESAERTAKRYLNKK